MRIKETVHVIEFTFYHHVNIISFIQHLYRLSIHLLKTKLDG